MQLASQLEEQIHNLSPPTYAALLIDPFFKNLRRCSRVRYSSLLLPLLAAVKTGQDLLWPCVAFLLVLSGAARAVDMHRYSNKIRSDRQTSRALGRCVTKLGR